MSRVTIRLSESALADLASLRAWYKEQSVAEVGDRFLIEILERIDLLRDHPEMGRVVPEFHQPALRELIHPPFRIVHRREKSRVQVVRIWRSERLLRLPSPDDA